MPKQKKVYRFYREADDRMPTIKIGKVEVIEIGPDGQPARSYPLKHVVHHSPTGIEWGYAGSGPADCAVSVLSDHLGPECKNILPGLYQRFKDKFIAPMPFGGGEITSDQISEWLNNLGS